MQPETARTQNVYALTEFARQLRGEKREPDAIDMDAVLANAGLFEHDKIALRVYRNVASHQLAGCGYHGFCKNPAGTDPFAQQRIAVPARLQPGPAPRRA